MAVIPTVLYTASNISLDIGDWNDWPRTWTNEGILRIPVRKTRETCWQSIIICPAASYLIEYHR
jgi:hypothetical protein